MPSLAVACVTLATTLTRAQPTAAGAAGSAAAAGAAGSSSAAGAGAPATGLQAPVLLEDAPAEYPEAARAQGLSGKVVLRLTIDASGRVIETELLEPAGHGFDEAARAAALALRFEPARRNGEPISSKIRYPFEFHYTPPTPQPGAIEGDFHTAGTPLAGARIVLSPLPPATAQTAAEPVPQLSAAGATAPTTRLETTTDAAGHFQLANVQPGSYELRASSADRVVRGVVDVAPAQTARVTLELPPPPPPAAPVPAAAVEVMVAGTRNEGTLLQHSAAAVNVIDTRKAQRQSADLGEVLARTQGVAVRRYGGLGSTTRFSLNGLYDEQIRFFLDTIPLDIAGYPLGIANVPVNLVERVEVYRGVVPVRFGADALGGAVNLVTDQRYRPRLAASYQVGSYGTHRMTLDGRYRHDPSGLVIGATSYYDTTKNNYDVDVEIADDRGRLAPATVPRFHDGYRAFGGTVEVGVVDRPWAKRLLLKGLVSSYSKELQHNIVMTVPYGEVRYGEMVAGGTARYEVEPARGLSLEVVGSYSYRVIDYIDKAQSVYDWRGKRVRPRRIAGEVEARPHDQTEWQHSAFGRAQVGWTIAPGHQLRAALRPAFASRSGDERLQADPNARDPLTAQRDLFTFVSGLEYELDLFKGRLSNILFVKDYYYQANSEEPLPGGAFRKRDMTRHSQGAGDSLRLNITPWLYAKASYEYATRLPSPYEVFGNGVLVRANLELEPEVSHNANFGPRLELTKQPFGDLIVDSSAFWRLSDRLIVLLGNDRYYTYQNVYKARGLGVENAVSWTSPGRWLSLDGTFTWQDVRNASTEGAFDAFKGDRIPNRPYLFGSWGARVRVPKLPGNQDTLEPFYNGRYVHSFFRGWESQGVREFKQTVDAQVTHSVGVSWSMQRDEVALTTTLEIDNLTDAKVYDNFGVQRPGRAFYLKLTGELR